MPELYTTTITSDQVQHSLTHAWLGQANNSQSVESYDGQPIRRNLIPNPNFETSLDTWSFGNNTPTRDTATSRIGSASVKLVATGGGRSSLYVPVAVTPGQTYTLTSWIKLPTDVASPVGNLVEFYDNTQNYNYMGQAYTNTDLSYATDWTPVGLTFTVPDGVTTTLVYPAISLQTAKSGDTVYVDTVLFELGSVAQDYFDGSSATRNMYGSTTPVLIDGWTETSTSQNIVNQVVGGGFDITLQRGSLRSGSFDMLYADEETAFDAFQMHQAPAVFTITDADRSSVAMTYVVDGQITRQLDDESRELWKVTINYQEVAS